MQGRRVKVEGEDDVDVDAKEYVLVMSNSSGHH